MVCVTKTEGIYIMHRERAGLGLRTAASLLEVGYGFVDYKGNVNGLQV